METVNEIKNTPVRNFINRHKVGISVISTAVICLAINRRAMREHDEFLKEHDLYDEYYLPEDSY